MPLSNPDNFFEVLLDELNADIVIFDLDWHYIYINRHAVNDPEIRKWLIGKTDFDYCTYRNKDTTLAENRRKMFESVLANHKETEWEEILDNAEGIQTYHLRRLSPLFDSEGKLCYVIGYGLNITERKKIQEELRESKELNKQIIENTPHLIFVKDSEGRFLLVNEAMSKSFRRDPQQIVSRKNSELHDNISELDLYSSTDKEVIEQRKEIRLEEPFTIPTGEVKWFDTIKVPLEQPDGTIHVLGISTDITQKKRAEEQLKQSGLRMKEAQEMAHFGNWEYDVVTGEILWSDELCRIYGVPVGTSPTYEQYLRTIHPDDVEMLVKRIENALINGDTYEVDHRIVLPDQSVKAIHSIGKAFRNDNNKVVKLVGTALEVTDRKKIEETLVLARQHAEETARIKENFLANVSHELRTPINGILGMAGLLYKTKIDGIQRNYLDILRTTAEHLLIIVNDILDYSKIESGKLTIEKIPFNLKDTVTTSIQTQLYKAEEKDLALSLFLPAFEIPPLSGDPYRLNQIILNLLSNAIKFTEHGSINLTCSVLQESSDQIEIEFSVRDTGIGIETDKAESIFESFTQASSSISRQYGGSGLGLTICRQLVEMQGGRIWLHSEPGIGSDFRFVINFDKADVQAISSGIPQRVEFTSLGKLRVLLAEDNRVNQFITEAMLQDWGFVVDSATNGREAISLINQYYYDIILMDIQMPDLNGIDAMHIIRNMSDKKKAKTPIIALTANTSRTMHKKYISEGMTDLLVKPYKEVTLFSKIATHIKNGDPSLISALQRPRFPARKKPSTQQVTLYDLSLLQNDSKNNPAFIQRMLTIFIESIPPIIEQMKYHLLKNEIDSICSLAHKLKPTLDGAGIISLRETIRNIEGYRDKKRTRDQLTADIQRLDEVLKKVVISFRDEISKHSAE
ncbi:MAG: ATP-binding protein [Bacteroidota bacterium]